MKPKKKSSAKRRIKPKSLTATRNDLCILPGTTQMFEVLGSGILNVSNHGRMPVYIAIGRDRKR